VATGPMKHLLIPALVLTIAICGCSAEETATEPPEQGATEAVTGDGITAEEDALILPGPPGTVTVEGSTPEGNSPLIVRWPGTRDDTISGYNVYNKNTGGNWTLIAFVPLRKEDPRNRGRYQYRTEVVGEGLYAVSAVDMKGTPGPKSPAVSQ